MARHNPSSNNRLDLTREDLERYCVVSFLYGALIRKLYQNSFVLETLLLLK